MAAAPADFRADRAVGEKITARAPAASSSTSRRPRTSSPRSRPAARRPDAGRLRRRDGGDGVERAREKLERKGADAIVLNDVSDPEIGFESESNEVTLIVERGETDVPLASKEASPTRSSTGSTRCVGRAQRPGYTEFELFCA